MSDDAVTTWIEISREYETWGLTAANLKDVSNRATGAQKGAYLRIAIALERIADLMDPEVIARKTAEKETEVRYQALRHRSHMAYMAYHKKWDETIGDGSSKGLLRSLFWKVRPDTDYNYFAPTEESVAALEQSAATWDPCQASLHTSYIGPKSTLKLADLLLEKKLITESMAESMREMVKAKAPKAKGHDDESLA